MIALKESAVRLVLAGETTVDEVVRSIYSVDEFDFDTLELESNDVSEVNGVDGGSGHG